MMKRVWTLLALALVQEAAGAQARLPVQRADHDQVYCDFGAASQYEDDNNPLLWK
jgi:hypothetical protein